MKRFFIRKFKFEGKTAWWNPFLAAGTAILIIAIFIMGFYRNSSKSLYENANNLFGKASLNSVAYTGKYILDNSDEMDYIEATPAIYEVEGQSRIVYLPPNIESLREMSDEVFIQSADIVLLPSATNIVGGVNPAITISGETASTQYMASKSFILDFNESELEGYVQPGQTQVLYSEEATLTPVELVYLNFENALYTQEYESTNRSYLSVSMANRVLSGASNVVFTDSSVFDTVSNDNDLVWKNVNSPFVKEGNERMLEDILTWGPDAVISEDAIFVLVDGESYIFYVDPERVAISSTETSNAIAVDMSITQFSDNKMGFAPIGYQETTQDLMDSLMAYDRNIAAMDVGLAGTQVSKGESYFRDDKYSQLRWSTMSSASLSDNSVDIDINIDNKNFQDMFQAFDFRKAKPDSVNMSLHTAYKFNFLPGFALLGGMLIVFLALIFLVSTLLKNGMLQWILLFVLVIGYAVSSLFVGINLWQGDYSQNSENLIDDYTTKMEMVEASLNDNFNVEMTDDMKEALVDMFSLNIYGEDIYGYYYNSENGEIEEDALVKSQMIREKSGLIIFGWILGFIFAALVFIFSYRKNGFEQTLNTLYNFSTAYLFILPGIIGMMILVFVPIIFTIILSFTSLPKYFTEINIARNYVGLQNFGEILYLPDSIRTRVGDKELTVKYHLRDDRGKESFDISSAEPGEWVVVEYYSSELTGLYTIDDTGDQEMLAEQTVRKILSGSADEVKSYIFETTENEDGEVVFTNPSNETLLAVEEEIREMALDGDLQDAVNRGATIYQVGNDTILVYLDDDAESEPMLFMDTVANTNASNLKEGVNSYWIVYAKVAEDGSIERSSIVENKDQLRRLFSNERSFYYTLVFTLLYTIVSLAIQVTLGVFVAVILYDKDVKFKGLYQVLFMLPWIIPTYISGLIWNYIFTGRGVIDQIANVLSQLSFMKEAAAGLVDAGAAAATFESGWMRTIPGGFLAVSFVNAWYAFPFIMLVTLSALQTIPKSVFEAALIDGANWFQTLFKIVIPMIRPTVLPSVLLTSIWTFNNFELVYLFTGGDDRFDILVTRIYDFLNVSPEVAAQRGWTYGYAAAYSALIFVVLLVYIYIFARSSNLTEKSF